MKTLILAAVAALTAVATPAMAQDFTGVRVGVTGGYDDVQSRDGFTYGGVVGVDAPVAKNIIIGVEATLEDSTAKVAGVHASRELGVAARAGVVVLPKTLVFAKVGYTNARFTANQGDLSATFEGLRYGAGVEYAVTKHTYVSAEYRRTELEKGFGGRDGALVGVGIRF